MGVQDVISFLFSLSTFCFSVKKIPVHPTIPEASGIADSKTCPGFLWVQEDSGNPPELHLLSHNGKVVKKVFIKGAENNDWEDLALCGNDLYIADIGDNNKERQDYTIYQLPEPSMQTDTVTSFTTIRFRYADGPHNAEAFLVDPLTKDIYIITKSDHPTRIYRLEFPYSVIGLNEARLAGKLPYRGVVSAALSPQGAEIMVKTYFGIKQYCRKPGEPLNVALQGNGIRIPYLPEPQGEAITYALSGKGYYTLSEKSFMKKVRLRFMNRP